MSEINSEQIEIVFNSEALVIEKNISVADLLQQLNVITNRFVVVINDQILPKSSYVLTQLKTGDRCDIMSPISGG